MSDSATRSRPALHANRHRRRHPSLALGIGANTAIFSLINALMLRSLPVKDPQRLVQMLAGKGPSWTNPLWEQIRQRDRQIVDGAFAYSTPRFNLAAGGETQFVNGVMASGKYFDVLGVRAFVGRTFGPADDVRGGGPDGPVAVISGNFWLRHFGGAPNVIGKPIMLDQIQFTVIGVTPSQFTGIDQGNEFDVAIPLGRSHSSAVQRKRADQRSWWWLRIIARLKPGTRSTTRSWRSAPHAADPRSDAAAKFAARKCGPLPERSVQPPAGREASKFRRQYRDPLFPIKGVGRCAVMHARTSRTPARSRQRAPARAERARRARCIAVAHRAAAAG
jgi:hypothetical protein